MTITYEEVTKICEMHIRGYLASAQRAVERNALDCARHDATSASAVYSVWYSAAVQGRFLRDWNDDAARLKQLLDAVDELVYGNARNPPAASCREPCSCCIEPQLTLC